MVAFILLLLWPIAELFVFVKLAQAIGFLLTVALLIASWPLGMWVLRSQAGPLWRRAVARLSEGRSPGREALDAVLVVFSGVLLLIPGFITDVFGLALLLAPVRMLVRRAILRHPTSRALRTAARFAHRRRGYDAEATAREFEPPRLQP